MRLGSGWCRSRHSRTLLLLVGDQAYSVHAKLSHFVYDVYDIAVTHSDATLDIDDPILFVLNGLQHRIDFVDKFFFCDPLLTKVVLAIVRNGDYYGRLLNNIRVDIRVRHILSERKRYTLLQKWCHHHEDDQQDKHDIDHCGDVNFRGEAAAASS